MSDSIELELANWNPDEVSCCICDPRLPVNPNVCYKHKREGLTIARAESIRYSEAADRLYWQARDRQDPED